VRAARLHETASDPSKYHLVDRVTMVLNSEFGSSLTSCSLLPAPLVLLPLLLACISMVPDSVVAQGSPTWQQRVEYEMDVRLDVGGHQMGGHQILHYSNNSPDTLHHVYYHLYFNAFNPHSAMAERNRELPDPDSRIVPRIFNLAPDEVGYHRIDSLTQDGTTVDFRIEDTVMKVQLAQPIPPAGSSIFEMNFRSQIPLQTRRSGRDNREGIDYSMTQWYPKMANYDSRGWHADPYVGREFYAPFGTFDVRITLPAEYVIGATGVLQNPDEIGHGYGFEEDEDTAPGDTLTWHFHAENVHDFAWTADPDYVHDVVEHNGVDHHLLYEPDVAENWAYLQEWLPAMIEIFSDISGRYPYPQVTVAQGGDGGMEYPMITLITGHRSPASLLGVTAHEVAHMWYYGALGSNEADYAWLDEGFASYVAAEVQARLVGRTRGSHVGSHTTVLRIHDRGLYEPMNTPSDWFRTNTAYSTSAYSAGTMVLDMLGYVISDSLRDRFLIEYFERFKFRHPNPVDVEIVAEDVSGLRLDWYFEQFTNTTWQLDYAFEGMSTRRIADGWQTMIEIERKGDIAMPIDLRLTYEDGTQQWVNVPLNIMNGHKPVPDDWIVAEPWSWTDPEYRLQVNAQQQIRRVALDPALRTPDANRLNNSSGFPVNIALFDAPFQSWERYSVGWRPLVQYARNFGFGGGVQFRGTYIFNQFQTRAMLKFWPEVMFSRGDDPDPSGRFTPPFDESASAIDGIDFELQFVDRIQGFGPYGIGSLRTEKHLGILESEIAFTTPLHRHQLITGERHDVSFGLLHQLRTTPRATATEVAFGFFPENMVSGYASYAFTNERTRVEVRAEVGGIVGEGIGSSSANKVYVDAARATPIGPITAGTQIRAGWGAENLAMQKRYRLGEATYEDRWANDAYRTIGAVFADPLADPGWIAFAGPGPIAYATGSSDSGNGASALDAPSGNNVLAASAVLVSEPFQAVRWLTPLQAEIFVGAGSTWNGSDFDAFSTDGFLFDAGIGFRYDVSRLPALRRWAAQSDVLSNLHVTAKFPIWTSDDVAGGSTGGFDFRWVMGITIDDAPWY